MVFWLIDEVREVGCLGIGGVEDDVVVEVGVVVVVVEGIVVE